MLVEDNVADVVMATRALEALGRNVTVEVRASGQGLAASIGATPTYDLIILDISLPGASGHELLAQLRNKSETRWTPIVMMSSSDAPDDVRRSYGGGANCHLVKPATFRQYQSTIQGMARYWLETLHSPSLLATS